MKTESGIRSEIIDCIELDSDNSMKKRTFDILVIVLATVLLIGLNQYGLLEKSAKFMLIPILGYYFLGQYVQRKFQV